MRENVDTLGGVGTRIRPLTPREFQQIRRLAYDKFGLDLREGKQELVSARLSKQLREMSFQTFQQYYEHVQGDSTGEALIAMIDALTTNYTCFLREPAHFEFLRREILPELKDAERIRIWSAACSTGEEPYSIALCVLEELGGAADRKAHILATDISTRALATAQRGVYPSERFAEFPRGWLPRYLLRGQGRWRDWYRLKPPVKSLVEFRRLNLTESLAHLPRFHVIFCRNVLIYFDKTTQEGLVGRLVGRLEPGGYLLTGHSESLLGNQHGLHYVRPAVYRVLQEEKRDSGSMRQSRCDR